MPEALYLGIDVGTGSARAGLFDDAGRMRAHASVPIRIWRPEADFAEQSSDDIWSAVCRATKEALAQAGASGADVAGIGFDATCSLVALDADDRPVTVSPTGSDEQNVVLWMDHRAMEQTARINATGHDVLAYVGGEISVEMQMPKLLWLKENLPQTWKRAARFFDLPDFLVYRATGTDVRSLCSTVCKWTYQGHKAAEADGDASGWDEGFFRAIGLDDFVGSGLARIGTVVRPMGEPVGEGLCERSAAELGLRPGTPVGVSIIDAHAGGIGMIGAPLDGESPSPESLNRRLALIGGTSSCHMAVSPDARYIEGVWGPYYSAMIPGLWLTEGGQSATGALIDHVIESHACAAELHAEAKANNTTVYDLLNARIDALAQKAQLERSCELTRDLHVLPYFHGNRSPRADASLRGAVSGLSLDRTPDALALLYLATIQAIAHGTRHILDALNAKGYAIDTVIACGGGTKNPLFLREHADITGCRIVLPEEPEAVLVGSAILGAVAARRHESLVAAMGAMNRAGGVVEPNLATAEFHRRKHAVFHRMYDDFMAWRHTMTE